MKNIVLDTSAFLAYLYDEPGADIVESVLNSDDCTIFIHATNVIEICYKLANKNEDSVLFIHSDISDSYLLVDSTLDNVLQMNSAILKVRFPMLSLADTMSIALAERRNAELYTTDKEFNRVKDLVNVVQLR